MELAGAVVKAPKSCPVTSFLRSLQRLKINECVEYKLVSLRPVYEVLTHGHLTSISTQPHLCSASSQHSLSSSLVARLYIHIVVVTNNRSLLSIRRSLP